jgi:UDP-glucose 4-epimerase
MPKAKRIGRGPRGPAGHRSRVIAVVGAAGFLGKRLVDRLLADPDVDRVLACDIRPPDLPVPKLLYHRVDLTRPSADQELGRILADEGAATLVHLAFLANPIGDSTYAHELEAIGTLHVLNACAEAGVRRLVVQSTTALYGAHPKHPARIPEGHEPGPARSQFLADKAEAERQVLRFAGEHPGCATAVLRLAHVVGPSVRNVFTRYLNSTFAPTLLGHDPLVQALHEDDAVEALRLAVERPELRGVYNVGPDDAVPLSTALGLTGAVAVPLLRPLAAVAVRTLRSTGLGVTPPSLLDFLRYPCVADGDRFRREAGFSPLYSTRDAIASLASPRERRAAG